MPISLFDNIYENKRVLVTGHTGFKGSWLTLWLLHLGAKVAGFSSYLPSEPCNYEALELKNKIDDYRGDIRDLEELNKAFIQFRPEVVFHLAAQPIVRRSYDDPKLTFDTNLGGTVNILECIRTIPGVRSAVLITSDKCYQNLEWTWGYRENDRLGGDDPYSASKACAEIAFQAYCKSFFQPSLAGTSASVATVRAGNVIGGGDWAQDRIIPDSVRAWTAGIELIIRNPDATRPWQHVLEPLGAYLCLASNLLTAKRLHGESFNFGPQSQTNKSVKELIELFMKYWGKGKLRLESSKSTIKESTLLKLSCDKALHLLNWHPILSFDDTVRLTAQWYQKYYNPDADICDYTISQIEYYITEAKRQHLPWIKEI